MTYPITPPPGLVEQWVAEACPECRLTYDEFTGESVEILAARAAQWGADQELEACCEWLCCPDNMYLGPSDLRAARRPKPPSLREQALTALHAIATGADDTRDLHQDLATIRQALEHLND